MRNLIINICNRMLHLSAVVHRSVKSLHITDLNSHTLSLKKFLPLPYLTWQIVGYDSLFLTVIGIMEEHFTENFFVFLPGPPSYGQSNINLCKILCCAKVKTADFRVSAPLIPRSGRQRPWEVSPPPRNQRLIPPWPIEELPRDSYRICTGIAAFLFTSKVKR